MKRNYLKLILLLLTIVCATQLYAQGTECISPTPFCANGLDPYPAGVDAPAAPAGNNYDCLSTQPNPAWFSITVSADGDLSFTLDNSNSEDIDFIVYGPFPDLATAGSQCGNLGNGGASGEIADCSYSASAVEPVNITNAAAGDVYLMMITNYSNDETDIFATANTGNGDYDCDCQTTVWFDEAPVGYNDAVLVDTTSYSADFVVCAGNKLGFTVNVKADSIIDSLGVYLPNTTIADVFGISNINVFGPIYPISGRFDTANFVVTINTDSTHVGVNDFVFSVLNSSCIQDLDISLTVVGVNAVAEDTSICAAIEQDIQLTASSFAPSGGDFIWSQIAGPTVGISDLTIPNPVINIPSTTVAGDSVVMKVEFTSTPDTILGTPCISTGYVTIYLVDDAINLTTTASDYFLCQNGEANTVQLNTIASGPGIDSLSGEWNWSAIPASYTTDLSDSAIAAPVGTFIGNPGDSIDLFVSYDYGACAGTDTIQLNFNDWVADVQPATNDFCLGDVISLNATPVATNCAPVYTVSNIPYAPVNFGGSSLSLTDESLSGAVSLGFDFEFFCNVYNEVDISSNGFITFNLDITPGLSEQLLPNSSIPNNLIALAWDDLNPNNCGEIRYTTTGSIPNRRFIVEYKDVCFFSAGAGTVDVQAILYETTNIIEIHLTNIPSNGRTMTVGLENEDGTIGFTPPAYNREDFGAINEAWRFQPSLTFNPTYAWSPNTNISDATAQNPEVTPNATTTYTVEVTESGCTMIDSAVLSISPVIPLDAPIITCDSSTTRSVSFGWTSIPAVANYEYSLDGGTTWTSTTDTFYTATNLVPGSSVTIDVRGIAPSGACATGLASSQTCAADPCTLTMPTVLCNGSTLSSVSFIWNAIPNATAYEYSLNNGTTWVTVLDTFYTVTGLAPGSAINIQVRAFEIRGCATSSAGFQTCTTDTCDFTAPVVQCNSNAIDSIVFNWTTLPAADLGYEYSTDGGASWITTLDSFVVLRGLSDNTNVTINVRGVSSAAVCSPSAQGSTSCSTLPCSNPQISMLNSNNTYCTGGSNAYVVVNSATGATLPFEIELSNGQLDTIFAVGDTIFRNIAVGSYTATLTELNSGCTSSGTIEIAILDNSQSINIDITQTNDLACGDTTGAELTVDVVLAAPGVINYNWSNGATTSVISNLAADTYSVTASDATGTCITTKDFTVIAPLVPTLDAYLNTLGQDSVCITIGESIDVNAGANENDVTYSWSPNEDIDVPNDPTAIITPSSPGVVRYTITATSVDNCETTDEVVLCVEDIGFDGLPTAFTPGNGDNLNSIFRPVDFVGGTISRFEIYNRWGNKLHEDNVNYEWDGTVNGELQPRDTYIYVIEYQFPGEDEPTVLRGSITLL